MNQDLITIIVPIYNVEAYLPKCIESILNQTYSNIEIILVNDGSPDNSGEICKRYANEDKRIKIVNKPNGGLSDARNAGLNVASGEYVIFVDSDDYIEKNLVNDTYTKLREHSADLCCFNYSSVDECGNYLNKDILELDDKIYNIDSANINDYLITKFLTYKHGIEAWDRIYKMKIIKDNNLRFSYNHEIFAEDLMFNLLYLTHTNKIVTISKSYYNYLIRTDSIMAKPKKELFRRYLELFTRLKTYWEMHNSNMKDCVSLGYFIWLIATIKLKFGEGLTRKVVTNELKSVSRTSSFTKMRNDILKGKLLKGYIKKCPGKSKHAVLIYIIALSSLINCEFISVFLVQTFLVKRR